MRIRYLIRFEKRGNLKYIGHLDLLRLLHRCIKLSGIDIDYSKGFNPHILASVVLPLTVGSEGLSEYAVFEMKTETGAERILEKLNAVMPYGLKCLNARKMPDNEKPSGAICAAQYFIEINEKFNLPKIAEEILQSEKILAEKPEKIKKNSAKHSERANAEEPAKTDIRPLIYDVKAQGEKELRVLIAQGSMRNLRPELLVKHIYENQGALYFPYKINYIRSELYKADNRGNLVSIFQTDTNSV
ncbi:MAG: TIGR03936 family radical SAM-associated protein [Clostridiales bacterium]|jgi:radical SAM-linked protein|nr:TIGR03936 family radical SAM-associated protein [Clostridiales bacterium]